MTNASPWSQACIAATQQSFTPYCAVNAYVNGRSAAYSLPPVSVRMTIDGRRTPRWQATVVCALPSKDVRAVLDPRNGLRVEIVAGYRIQGVGLDAHRLCLLRADTVARDIVANTITFGLTSDEAVVVDFPFDTAGTFAAADSNKVAAIKAAVAACFPGVTLTWSVGSDVHDGATFAAAQVTKYGQDRWEAITDWADTIDANVHSDGYRSWRIEKPPTVAKAAIRAKLTTGPKGNVSSLIFADTRGERFATKVMLQYESRSGSTTTTTTVVASTTLTPPRMRVVTRKRPPDEPRNVAKAILRRALKRTHRVTIEAPGMWWLRPGHSVTVTDPERGQDRVIIDTVELDVTAGTMRLVGREPYGARNPTISIDTFDESTT